MKAKVLVGGESLHKKRHKDHVNTFHFYVHKMMSTISALPAGLCVVWWYVIFV